MVCINCFDSKTKVTNSRSPKKNPQTWRRRECPKCGFAFTTYEDFALDELLMVQSGKSNASYNRGKLLASIISVLQPVADDMSGAYWLVRTIEQKLIAEQRAHGQWQPVTPQLLADLTYDTLLAYNQAAGLSYAVAHGLITPNQKPRRGRPRG